MYIGNMYIWVHYYIYILPLCVPLKRHQTTEVCCALYCSNRTCACSTTKTTTSDLVKLCFAWRQKPVKSVTSSTLFLIKKSYWWETYTQIYCFVRTSWTTSQKYEQMLNNKYHQLWEVFFIGFSGIWKIKCIFDEVYSIVLKFCCYPTRIDP